MDQHLPAGSISEPVVELSIPHQGLVIILAVVLRPDEPAPGIERWTFSLSPDGQNLSQRGAGIPILRLQPGPRHPELSELRRNLATPRVTLTRPMGLAADSPQAAVEQLMRALTVMGEASESGRARVEATATVFRALDDPIVFERDAIGELRVALRSSPQRIEVQSHSTRRATATVVFDPRRVELELQHKSAGWALVSFTVIPSPEPVVKDSEVQPPR